MKPKLYQEHFFQGFIIKIPFKFNKDTVMYELQINLDICRQTLAAIPADILEQVKAEAENYEVIGIDEGQFVS